ncbi:MAG: choice-of-anchor D domain-containing protein, partial [Methylococcales bacterium]|nr:choice-of-anchor D domain-containing protein [Methylococcales bacterium]
MPGESIGLDVSFMREDTLTVANELRITSDDPLGNDVVSIGLSGRSVAPVLALAADTLDFGNIFSESQLSVMVSNDGTDTLNVSAISFPTGFTGSMADSTLAPGEAAELTVSITPEDNGYWTGDVLLTSDSYQQSEHSVALSALSMNVLMVRDFGGVLTGLSSDTTFTLNNTGNTDLVIDSLGIGETMFTTDLTIGTTVVAGGNQTITFAFSPIEREPAAGNVLFYTPAHAAPLDFGTLSGDGWAWPEAEFAAKSLSVVTSRGDDVSFNITLTNSGDYALDYTVMVDADFAGFIWLTTAAGGQVSGTTTIDIPVNVEQTANLDPGTYNGFISFSTNTGTDPAVILPGTDTVDVFLTLLADDSQLADTTVTVESGNTEAIVFINENGDPMGIVVDFANSNGGSVTVKSIAAQPPVDENTPWVDPDGLITEPVFPAKYFEITTDIEGAFLTDIGFDYTALPGIEDPMSLRLAKRPGNAGLAEPWSVIAISSMEYNITDGLILAQNQTSF